MNRSIRLHRAAGPIAAVLLASCGGADERNGPADASAVQADLDRAAGGQPESTPANGARTASAEEMDGTQAASVTEVCERISASEARAAAGLEQTGRAGDYRFSAPRRGLLCSEAGAGGVGECDVVGNTVILVESDGESYGLSSRADVPTILRYGPDGVYCVRRTG